MRAKIADCQRRRTVESRVAMEINALAGGDKGMEIVEGHPKPLGHRIGATVLDWSPHEADCVRVAFRAHCLEVQPVQAQVVVVLKIVNCGDVKRILEPSDIFGSWVLADQKVTGD